MIKKNKLGSVLIAVFIAISVLLLIAVLGVMSYVQGLLHQDVRISLTEIVNQNKNVITSKISLEVNNLNIVSKQLSEQLAVTGDISDRAVEEAFLGYAQRTEDPLLCWANKDGEAVYGDRQRVNVAGRRYFQYAMQGDENISEQLISRLNGDDIFVISVPFRYEDEIIGTIQKQYTPEEMYDICSISIFSEQGDMFIINSDGYVLISSLNNENGAQTGNYYRSLYLHSPEDSKTLENNVRAGESGFFESSVGGEDAFFAYTPIEMVRDWYLITSIKTTAVMANSNNAIMLMYTVLFVFLMLITSGITYIVLVRNRQQKRLEKIAFNDEVTGGFTYTKFQLDVKKLFAGCTEEDKLSIVAVDIDGFKYINRFYGFEIGDMVLKEVHDHFVGYLTSQESLARISSDYFVLALKNASQERLEKLFCSELIINNVRIYLSAGLYPVTDMTESINLMMDKANLARHEVKGKHFKRVELYSIKSDEVLARNEQIKTGIEAALLNDELIPFFQPKVDTRTNRLVGAEALARWIKPDGKMVSPGEFIPICEETGLISLVDWRIFEKTVQFIRRALDNGVGCVPISVNFSRINLMNADFFITMRETLEEYRIPRGLIEIELTETVIFDNADIIGSFIEQLHKIGLKISMDDFGSGYSSLQMLKDVNIDVLKIDRGFLMETSNSEKQKIVFETIVHMAKRLDIDIVVEGVETLENIELMHSSGCSVAQGYYYSKPVATEVFEGIYKNGSVERS